MMPLVIIQIWRWKPDNNGTIVRYGHPGILSNLTFNQYDRLTIFVDSVINLSPFLMPKSQVNSGTTSVGQKHHIPMPE